MLQRGDRLADARGAAGEALCGAAEAEFLGHGEKALLTGEVHGASRARSYGLAEGYGPTR
ncbi:hypothetical protein GCM10020295_80300 [Streptomyces cinereospinus]